MRANKTASIFHSCSEVLASALFGSILLLAGTLRQGFCQEFAVKGWLDVVSKVGAEDAGEATCAFR